MDRELTPKEKKSQAVSQQHRSRRQHRGILRVSYASLVTVSTLAIFLVFTGLINRLQEGERHGLTRHDSRGLAPDPEAHPDPVVQVYSARTWGAKGTFAVHCWIAMKRRGAPDYEVSQVIGWRMSRYGKVLFREKAIPDKGWYGKEPTLLLDRRGPEVETLIDKIDQAINSYPWTREYTAYPGPNSNTFIAWIGLQVPELGLDLPSTAIGKDWRPISHALGLSPSGTGIQASLFGLLGASTGLEEGLELNVLGLNLELDLLDLAVEVPIFGRFSLWYFLLFCLITVTLRKYIRHKGLKYFYV